MTLRASGPRAYLGLGANLGDRAGALQRAVNSLMRVPRVAVVAVSGVYVTEPVGGPEQPEFYNAVVAIETGLTARELLELAQRLETDAHRVRHQRWGPRTLDVDVLLVGDLQVDEPDLVVPHPRMWERGFVLAPLADVAPELVDVPASGGWRGVRRADVSLVLPEHW
ncbi:MAG: 2-amino-4-hydroxy-6-hydroxymethyldihydropteridine diphosphokinase [Acidimicrobiia bacterium]